MSTLIHSNRYILIYVCKAATNQKYRLYKQSNSHAKHIFFTSLFRLDELCSFDINIMIMNNKLRLLCCWMGGEGRAEQQQKFKWKTFSSSSRTQNSNFSHGYGWNNMKKFLPPQWNNEQRSEWKWRKITRKFIVGKWFTRDFHCFSFFKAESR